MKRRSKINVALQSLIYSMLLSTKLFIPEECFAIDLKEEVFQAYEIRMTGHADSAKVILETALLEADPSKTTLYLDMARYYFMSSRMDPEKSDAYLPRAETAVSQFLETEPIIPLKAYAYNMLSWIKRGLEQNEEAERMRAQAQSLDPNVSQASAIPPQLLFDEPDQISTYHSYFSRPF